MGLWFQTSLAAGEPVQDRADFVTGPSSGRSLGTVLGWGENQEQAKEYALEKVRGRVEKYLHSQLPGLEWYPPKEYIHDRLLKDPPERRKDKDQEVEVGKGEHIMGKCWEWRVEVTAEDRKDILRHDREGRVHQRMGLLGKILAGLLVLLSVVAGYIRLDEWTKGYYTGWLRLAAAGIVAAVGTGLWWLS
jgi:hypothetical protein